MTEKLPEKEQSQNTREFVVTPQKKTFDPKLVWQFEHPEHFQIGKAKDGVDVFEVTPDSPKSEVPVFFGLGFSNEATTYRPNILALAKWM